MPVYQTARFRVRPESLDTCRRAIEDFVAHVKTHEPGTLTYVSLQQRDAPTSFLHVFVFQDEAARDRHANSDAVKRFTAVLYPETLAPVEFTEYSMVATTHRALRL